MHELRFNFLLHESRNCLLILWQRFPALCRDWRFSFFFSMIKLIYCTVFFLSSVWQSKSLVSCASIFELLKTLSAFLIPPWRPVWRFNVPMFHNKLCCKSEGRKVSESDSFPPFGGARAHENEREMQLSESIFGSAFLFDFVADCLTWSFGKSPASARRNLCTQSPFHRLTVCDWNGRSVCETTSHFPPWLVLSPHAGGNLITSPTKPGENLARNDIFMLEKCKAISRLS